MPGLRHRAHTLCTYALALSLAVLPSTTQACTRAVYLGPDGMIVTGRTMDWAEDIRSNLWIFPRGMDRNGGLGAGSFRWTSKYGSVIASGYDVGTADGMNEAGLVANVLYLVESTYPLAAGDTRPTMSIGAWAQYPLDSFSTVADAVAALEKEPFRIVAPVLPNGAAANLHLSLSDVTGDSAIFEYVDGQLVVHHGRQYQVMTNSPIYSKQLALAEYWQVIGGTTMLPGTNRAADRFARTSFYINTVTQTADPREAVAAVFSVMRNASVPRGVSVAGQPNIATTIWRTVSDQKNRLYYFEHTLGPSALWIRLNNLDFSPAAGVRKLTLVGRHDLGADCTGRFEKAEAFEFLGLGK